MSEFGKRVVLAAVDQKQVPDNAVSISERSEAPENAEIVEGERGGLYYIPSSGSGSDDNSEKPPETRDEPPESLNLDSVDSSRTLSEAGAEEGMFADQMEVIQTSDGRTVFTQDLEETANEFGDRIAEEIETNSITSSITTRELGAENVTHYVDDDNVLRKEGVDGQVVTRDYDGVDPDRGSFIDAIASAMITGNEDVHPGNLMIDQSDGTSKVIDYDRSGRGFRGGLTSDAVTMAENVDLDISESEFLERAGEMAENADRERLENQLPESEVGRIFSNLDDAMGAS